MGSIELERKTSIELEPLTLSFADLQLAREAALCIINTEPLEEAIKIFTEGLQPVPRVRNNTRIIEYEYGDDQETAPEPEEEEEELELEEEVTVECCLRMTQMRSLATASAPF